MGLSEAEELFELGIGYSLEDVKSARHRLALRYHPDVNNSGEAEAYMTQINIAYDLLVDAIDHGLGNSQNGWAAEQDRLMREQAKQEERLRREAEKEARRQAEAAKRDRERRNAEQRTKEHEYQRACEEATKAQTADDHESVALLFKALGDYRDSVRRSSIQQEIAEKERAFERHYELRRRERWYNVFSTIPTAVAGMLFWRPFFFIGGWLPPLAGIIDIVTELRQAYSKRLPNSGSSASWLTESESISALVSIGGSLLAAVFVLIMSAMSSSFPVSEIPMRLAVSNICGGISCSLGCEKKEALILKIVFACISYALLVVEVAPIILR